MLIGSFDQRVRFEVQGTTQDASYGPQPGAWTEVATVWASVDEVLPGYAERTNIARLETRSVRIRVRYREDITSAMRVVLVDRGNRTLKLVGGPSEIPRKRAIEIMAEEYSTSGEGA